MFDAESHRRLKIEVENRASGNNVFRGFRQQEKEKALQLFPEGIREHMKLCRVECPLPRYGEGMAVSIKGQLMWVKFRFWNEISREVVCILETLPGGEVCSLHEDILVREDDIHGERVDRYYEDKLFT